MCIQNIHIVVLHEFSRAKLLDRSPLFRVELQALFDKMFDFLREIVPLWLPEVELLLHVLPEGLRIALQSGQFEAL